MPVPYDDRLPINLNLESWRKAAAYSNSIRTGGTSHYCLCGLAATGLAFVEPLVRAGDAKPALSSALALVGSRRADKRDKGGFHILI